MKTVLFDLDCTLIDSMYVWHDGLEQLMETLGIECDFEAEMARFIKMKISEIYTDIKIRFHTEQDEAWMEQELDKFLLHEYKYVIQEMPGAGAYLKQCKARGCQTAIVTSSPLKLVLPVIRRLGMDQSVDHVISCEEIGMTKRDPLLYKTVLAGLEARPEDTILFEDSQVSIDSALQAGIRCIGIDSVYGLEGDFPVYKDFTPLLVSP